MRLAVAMWPYWEVRWRERQGVGYIDGLLRGDVDVPADVRAWALTAAAAMGGNAGDARLTFRGRSRPSTRNDVSVTTSGLAEALAALGLALGNQGQLDEADRVLSEGLESPVASATSMSPLACSIAPASSPVVAATMPGRPRSTGRSSP